ncbi:aminotransferase class I/II-fold pyridoxal phosphate-dependent enzyme [Pseudomonas syringae]|uniref:Aminotransferase class I/II-fold pyridoxal phosphate-dependent enzyme n=1 Tax=Pseudomonas syringae TaxID=317 RepID=A0A9Q3X077_PSESX|nr:aminotransferase class I/II-fold pyridoxal phosphate-dependent enzyme [Pseudomonas syringae]MCF5061858.1 aminotransferase class I/II-fold pyridoxal phosphate-dependent enzyme [Pseudomonas syringae]MCF5072669.1 aminotransferase class I/II-fold pyridoxal phosphate-dependent enzyme [Pseudomonas syringae]MCF5117585.1 aminotransferase class I/II-fold pyridoxal phosphate-dependent enzyme [Pseudomonas syringae]MCF5377866.1 aminotransferase class I/II-fold pyridoxal phosphate-dependent enzyme [Pseud
MMNTTFSHWPSFTQEEADAVRDVILSNKVNYWTGQECRTFEKEFAEWTNTAYAVAMTNGTVAIDAALIALGIGAGDEVIVTPRTFLASVSSIVNAGAVPVFAEVDRDSQNITADTIRAALTPRTKAVICVHLAGWPCDMDPIMALADEHGLKVIEDCAQAHGARYKGRPVGSIGHVGAWSFCQDKIMSTGGEGGMVTTNDQALWSRMWSVKDHGKSWEAVYEREHAPGFRWVHESFGTNWRMMETQAAIGRIQLRRMADWNTSRTTYAEKIWSTARDLKGLRTPAIPEDITHAAYKCYVFIEPATLTQGWSRDRILGEITARGVPCFSGSCSEVYLEKAFDNTGWRPSVRLPVARELGETSLMFLVHPTLSEAEIEKTYSVLRDVMNLATRQQI